MAGDSEFFTEEEWKALNKSKRRRKEVTVFRKWSLENQKLKYCLQENWEVTEGTHKCELSVLVFGKVGVGKSATANTILEKKVFDESMSPDASTTRCRFSTSEIDGRKICVIDTPGLEDLNRSNEDTLKTISRIIARFSKGIHAFVYVCNLACPRFTHEDHRSLSAFEQRFGGEAKKHRLVVYTHAECLPVDMNLDEFCEKQKESDSTIASFLEDMGRNIVAVNNASNIPAERKRNQSVIIAMVDRMNNENGYSAYTSNVIKEANKMRRDLMKMLSGQNINPKVIDTVIDVITEDPSKEFNIVLLKSEVEVRLKEELEQLQDRVSINALKMVEEELTKVDKALQETRKRTVAKRNQDETKASIKAAKTALATTDIEGQIKNVSKSHGGFLKRLENYVRDMWQQWKLW